MFSSSTSFSSPSTTSVAVFKLVAALVEAVVSAVILFLSVYVVDRASGFFFLEQAKIKTHLKYFDDWGHS